MTTSTIKGGMLPACPIDALLSYPALSDPERRALLFVEQGGRCFYCDQLMRPQKITRRNAPRDVTLDHLLPQSQGGRRRLDNEVAACNRCNGRRGTMSWLVFFCMMRAERQSRPVQTRD